MEEATRRLRALDFFMGVAFGAIGLYVAVDGYRMIIEPDLATVGLASNPGLTTLIVGGLLALLGAVMAVIGFRGSGGPFRTAREVVPENLRSPRFMRGTLILACIAVYFFVLWGRIPYVAATFVFLAGTMFLFRAGAWWKVLLISGTTVAIVWYVFGELAMVPLP